MHFLKRIALVGAGLAALCLPAAAQGEYPNRPIRLIVAFTAGGTTDIIARLVGHKLSESLGQQVIVENRPGAGGNIGSDFVAKSAPDGYTLLLGSVGPLAINASLYTKMPYDNLKDLAPVILVASVPNLLVVPPTTKANSVQDLIKLAREKPNSLNASSTGSGTASHLAIELLKDMANVDIVHVPYSGAVALNDLMAGRVQMMFATMPSVMGHVKAGKLKPLAVSSAKRAPALPDIPTVAEAGVPGFEAASWFGIVAPARTPTSVINKLNAAIDKIIHEPAAYKTLLDQGAEPVGGNAQSFGDYMKSETEKWAKIVKLSGAKAD